MNLLDYLKSKSIPLDKTKLHFAQSQVSDLVKAFHISKFQSYQATQSQKKLGGCEYVVSLIQLKRSSPLWMFAGVFRVKGTPPKKLYCETCPFGSGEDTCPPAYMGSRRGKPCWQYDTEEMTGWDDFKGKAIFRYKKTFKNYIQLPQWLKKNGEQIELFSLRPEQMSEPLPNDLREMRQKEHWELREMLKNKDYQERLSRCGIYLIQISTPLMVYHYVGKADGESGFFERWSTYAESPAGGDENGNQGLIDLQKRLGEAFTTHWTISVLETCDKGSCDMAEDVWKRKLNTKDRERGGLNWN